MSDQQQNEVATILPSRVPDRDAQRLLLFAVRRIASSGLDDAHAAHALLCTFGLRFRRPLVLVRALMAELSRVSSRKILVAPCCCHRMTAAEAAIVASVSTAVVDPNGAHRLLAATLGVDECLGALSSAQALGQAFGDLGKPLRG